MGDPSKEILLKKVIKLGPNSNLHPQTSITQHPNLDLQFQMDSRNVRLRLNSLKTDHTHEKKSFDNTSKKEPKTNIAESNEDLKSSKDRATNITEKPMS